MPITLIIILTVMIFISIYANYKAYISTKHPIWKGRYIKTLEEFDAITEDVILVDAIIKDNYIYGGSIEPYN